MTRIRCLSTQEYPDWEKLAAASPQASLFHSAAWNEMLCRTDPQECLWQPLVCENKGLFLGGLALITYLSGANRRAVPPAFGYNGPILNPQIRYADRSATTPAYSVLSELLAQASSLVVSAVIQNQPDIWDTRPYRFQGWQIETSYTHILPCAAPEAVWAKIAPALQAQIRSDGEYLSVKSEQNAAQIHSFCARAAHERPVGGGATIQAGTLEKRIDWMLSQDLCRLVEIHDRGGKLRASSLIILSRVNRSAYIWKTLYAEKKQAPRLFPTLVWQIVLHLAGEFERLDLLGTANPAPLTFPEQMGCELVPSYTAKFKQP